MVSLLQHLRRDFDLIQREEIADHRDQSLLLKEHGDLVGGWHVSDDQNLLVIDLAEVGDLLDGGGFEFAFATTGNLDCQRCDYTAVSVKYIPNPGSDRYSSPP
jgi:hypothetical protein